MTVQEYLSDPERDSFVLLDVRRSEERLYGRYVTGSLHIPMEEILGSVDPGFKPDTPIVVLCERGGRAEIVVNFLRAKAYTRVFKLEGGYVKLSPYVQETELPPLPVGE